MEAVSGCLRLFIHAGCTGVVLYWLAESEMMFEQCKLGDSFELETPVQPRPGQSPRKLIVAHLPACLLAGSREISLKQGDGGQRGADPLCPQVSTNIAGHSLYWQASQSGLRKGWCKEMIRRRHPSPSTTSRTSSTHATSRRRGSRHRAPQVCFWACTSQDLRL